MKIKSILYPIIYYSGLNYLYSRFLNKKLFVLMYHSISSNKDNFSLSNDLYKNISIDVNLFEKQMNYLKENGHTFISFSDLNRPDINKIRKPTIIYFDDGFKDVLLNAVPIMNRLNIRSTIFLVSGIFNETNMLWTILLRQALGKKGLSMREQSNIIEELKYKTDNERLEYMSQYSVADHKELFELFMNKADIVHLSKNGHDFGSHSVTHPRLSEASSEVVKYEITESKFQIEKLISKKINSFSFPYGRTTDNMLSDLEKAEYKYVVSKGKGLNDMVNIKKGIIFLKNISPKPGESLMLFKLRLYFLNII